MRDTTAGEIGQSQYTWSTKPTPKYPIPGFEPGPQKPGGIFYKPTTYFPMQDSAPGINPKKTEAQTKLNTAQDKLKDAQSETSKAQDKFTTAKDAYDSFSSSKPEPQKSDFDSDDDYNAAHSSWKEEETQVKDAYIQAQKELNEAKANESAAQKEVNDAQDELDSIDQEPEEEAEIYNGPEESMEQLEERQKTEIDSALSDLTTTDKDGKTVKPGDIQSGITNMTSQDGVDLSKCDSKIAQSLKSGSFPSASEVSDEQFSAELKKAGMKDSDIQKMISARKHNDDAYSAGKNIDNLNTRASNEADKASRNDDGTYKINDDESSSITMGKLQSNMGIRQAQINKLPEGDPERKKLEEQNELDNNRLVALQTGMNADDVAKSNDNAAKDAKTNGITGEFGSNLEKTQERFELRMGEQGQRMFESINTQYQDLTTKHKNGEITDDELKTGMDKLNKALDDINATYINQNDGKLTDDQLSSAAKNIEEQNPSIGKKLASRLMDNYKKAKTPEQREQIEAQLIAASKGEYKVPGAVQNEFFNSGKTRFDTNAAREYYQSHKDEFPQMDEQNALKKMENDFNAIYE